MAIRVTKKLSGLFWGLLISIILSACGNQDTLMSSGTLEPTSIPSPTPIQPTLTATLTLTLTRTPRHTHTPTQASTETSTPLPTRTPPIILPPEKNVLLDYSVGGNHGVFDGYVDYSWSNLVLYEDGQLIIPYKQKMLSPDEVNEFLSQLEALGFYTLETNQQHDPTDLLYDFGDQYSRTFDGPIYCILVTGEQGRKLCAYDPFREFLVPEMKIILAFLDNYQPFGMTPYEPDRILLAVHKGINPIFTVSPQKTVPWLEHFPSIETSDEKIMLVQGEVAKEIYELFDDSYYVNVFLQNGVEYSIYLEIVLPHEAVEQP